MEESVQQFIEKMGILCEKDGMARSAGRIFGLLLASDRPYSLDEIADKLQVSKASVSTNARMLEQLGMIERVSSLGDRRDFYRVEADPWERILRVAQGRWRQMLHVLADAREALPPHMTAGKERLMHAERFHQLLIDETDGLVARWQTLRAGPGRAEDAA
ncbi:MAG TPA: MarR family transcriptional regulator [Longimicrobiaceae bacterium]|nr:MarR family transcriptional regulator [Longimicrobiaceae bacterium]